MHDFEQIIRYFAESMGNVWWADGISWTLGIMFKLTKFEINLIWLLNKSNNHGSQIELSNSKSNLEMSCGTLLVSDPDQLMILFLSMIYFKPLPYKNWMCNQEFHSFWACLAHALLDKCDDNINDVMIATSSSSCVDHVDCKMKFYLALSPSYLSWLSWRKYTVLVSYLLAA